jgi:formylmethanofuran dehydrogenase subunit A
LADIPIVDKSTLTLMANNEIMLDQLEKGEYERAKQVVAWYLWAAKSYGLKAVNPVGWRHGNGGTMRSSSPRRSPDIKT